MDNKINCPHKEWMQRYVGGEWECVECGAKMSAGEMIIWKELLKQKREETDG